MDAGGSWPEDEPQRHNPETVTVRRLKKREADRRCQRKARARKQSHVAHLESLLDGFRQQDESGQVTALYTQLQKLENERVLLANTLDEIQHLLTRRRLPADSEQSRPASLIAPVYNTSKQGAGSIPWNPATASERLAEQDSEAATAYRVSGDDRDEFDLYDTIVQDLGQSVQAGTQIHIKQNVTYDWINPTSKCCCQTHARVRSGRATSGLDERFDWSDEVKPADDDESEDILVRAVLHGWGAVAGNALLHPSLQMLRRVDESMFRPVPKTERLAMLRAMHLLLQYHTDPTAERHARLPPWYTYRPSQHIAHTYAIDYWAWPHFRQRFILDEHVYCGNGFFRMYQDEMRLLWPFEFRDCFTHDLETDRYKPSRLFDERINNINCWTMGPDFFSEFPELSGVIPTNLRSIPKSMHSARNTRQQLLIGEAGPADAAEQTNAEDRQVQGSTPASGLHIPISGTPQHNDQSQRSLAQLWDEYADTYPAALDGHSPRWHVLLQPLNSTHNSLEYDLWISDGIHPLDMNSTVSNLAPQS
ncbi:hypothetical protein HII31_07162, partial [Pseudocercospora fuligena]